MKINAQKLLAFDKWFLHKIWVNETLLFNRKWEKGGVLSLENSAGDENAHFPADLFSPRQWSSRYCNRKLEIVLRRYTKPRGIERRLTNFIAESGAQTGLQSENFVSCTSWLLLFHFVPKNFGLFSKNTFVLVAMSKHSRPATNRSNISSLREFTSFLLLQLFRYFVPNKFNIANQGRQLHNAMSRHELW